MTYNPSIPRSTDRPSTSQGQILTNFGQINTIFGSDTGAGQVGDHIAFDSGDVANRGKHAHTRLIEQTGDPVTASNEMALYTKAVSAVTQLFVRDEAAGIDRQMTGLDQSSAIAGSRTILLPTGLRMNFGSVTMSTGAGSPITFHTAFTTSLFFVVANQQGGNSEAISILNPTLTGFTGRSSSSTLPGYYFAMGI